VGREPLGGMAGDGCNRGFWMMVSAGRNDDEKHDPFAETMLSPAEARGIALDWSFWGGRPAAVAARAGNWRGGLALLLSRPEGSARTGTGASGAEEGAWGWAGWTATPFWRSLNPQAGRRPRKM